MRIFLSVGSRFPMDRLVKLVDSYLAGHPDDTGIAQIGDSDYQASHLVTHNLLTPVEFRQHLTSADVFVSHAGIGNLLLSRELSKPIVIMAREFRYGEHINDHQLGTLKAFADQDFIFPATTDNLIDTAIADAARWQPGAADDKQGSGILAERLGQYINEL